MKILIIYHTVDTMTSSHRILLRNASLLSNLGNDVTLVFPQKMPLSTEMLCPNVKIKFGPSPLFPGFSRGGFSLIRGLFNAWLVLTGRYDLVYLFAAHRPAALLPALMSKLCRTIIVEEWWEWFGKEGISSLRKGIIGRMIGLYDSLLEIPSKRLCDGVIAIASELKERIPWHKHVVVLYGASEACNVTTYEIAEARRLSGLPEDDFIIGMSNVSKDDHEDNLPFFLAVQTLASEYKTLKLLVTGDSAYVLSEVAPLFSKDTLVFCGWLEFEAYNCSMSSCNIFALPYPNVPRNAGRWPNKSGDYFSFNRPIVTNPTGDFKSLFSKYKLGWLCDNMTKDYIMILKQLLEQPLMVDCKNFDSYRVANDMFSFEHRVKQIDLFFDSLLKAKDS